MTTEYWKPVVGYYGRYEVSDLGRVRRLETFRRDGRRIKPGMVSICLRSKKDSGKAYPCVALNDGTGQRTSSVHRLVLLAFVGPCPRKDMQGCHNNGKREDNRLINLRWDTPSGNQLDRNVHGTRNAPVGEHHPNAKLTARDVSDIFSLRESGLSQYKIASVMGICQPHVSDILNGKRWNNSCAA